MIEAFEETHAATAEQPGMQTVAEGVDVKERKSEEATIAVRDLPAADEIDRVRREVVVRQYRALRRARRARRVDDRGGSSAVETHSRSRLVPAIEERGEILGGDERARLGVVEDVG